jgi:hypothetical protein
MALYEKKINTLVPKAGLGIVDQILNKFSRNAVSNKVVTEELEQRVTGIIDNYSKVEKLAYDEDNNKIMLKVEGADTVIPFRNGNNFSLDAEVQKPIMFAAETQRMIAGDGYHSIMTVDQDYFEVISTKIEPNTYRMTEMVIKAKKNFTMKMLGGFYYGTFGFEPLFTTTSALSLINSTFSIVEGNSYDWVNRITNNSDTASACCYGVVVSE